MDETQKAKIAAYNNTYMEAINEPYQNLCNLFGVQDIDNTSFDILVSNFNELFEEKNPSQEISLEILKKEILNNFSDIDTFWKGYYEDIKNDHILLNNLLNDPKLPTVCLILHIIAFKFKLRINYWLMLVRDKHNDRQKMKRYIDYVDSLRNFKFNFKYGIY